jgi:hypothetical protein
MTELLLKVDHATKKVTVQGKVAAGEDVALTLDMGAPVDDIDQVRVRLRHLGTDVAVFPWLGEEWTEQTPGAEDGVYVGTWNTNTEELAAIFEDLPDRATHIFDVIVDQVPDDDETDDTCVMYGIGKIRLQKWSPDLTLTDLTEGPHPVTLLAALEGKIGKEELATALDGLADLAANSTQKDIRTKANQIIAILRGLATAAVAFFLGFSAFALPWEEVPPDTTVNTAIVGAEVGDGLALRSGVLSARGGISTNNVNDLIADATNAIPRGIDFGVATNLVTNLVTKAYVEDLGIEAGIDGSGATNIVTNVVTKVYVEDLGIEAGTDGETVTNIVNSLEKFVTPYMWPGDWFIKIEGYIPGVPASTYLMPTNDMLARMTGASGVWRSYKLLAEPDPVAASYGDPVPPVTFDYRDPSGAVASFTNDTLVSSGVAGVVHVSATDTNEVVREAAVVMTPVQPGRVANLYASETNVTERYIWAANLFEKLSAVSTDEADLVENTLCRTFADRYEVWKYATWKSPRQLSRFGSDGRIHTNEWAGKMVVANTTWEDLATPATPRAWAYAQNRDFFWPDLQTNLWCFSSACHESQATTPATGFPGFRSMPLMAVASHYAIGAVHYGDWVLSPWQCHPRFVKSTADNDYVLSHVDGAVGTVTYAHGNDSDIRVYRLKQTVPDQCIAHFATREVLQSLSPTLFRYVPCLTVNAHQVVTPYCLGGTGSTLYGWSAEPRTSTFTSPYPAGIAVPAQAADCVHMGHMYDSGDVFFLAAPNGRVVPLGQTKYLNDGGGLSGPSYLDDGILESLSALIRADSNGTEDIRFWTAADLYAGGVTNLVEDAP